MGSGFYTNSSEVKFIDKLKRNIDTCKAFYFSVNFIKKPGLRLLASNLEAAIARGACGRLITSTYQNFTDVDSLTFFHSLQTRYPSRFACRLDRECFHDLTGNTVGFHSKGYLYRNLIPENLFFDKKGYLHISDMTLVREISNINFLETSGNPGYMAPEILFRQKHGIESDFFSLGIILYEIMFNKIPFKANSREEYLNDLLNNHNALIKEDDLNVGWSRECADFINKCIQKKPEIRIGYEGIEELKTHIWIKDFQWEKLKKKELIAPFIPHGSKNISVRKFEEVKIDVEENVRNFVEFFDNMNYFNGYFYNYKLDENFSKENKNNNEEDKNKEDKNKEDKKKEDKKKEEKTKEDKKKEEKHKEDKDKKKEEKKIEKKVEKEKEKKVEKGKRELNQNLEESDALEGDKEDNSNYINNSDTENEINVSKNKKKKRRYIEEDNEEEDEENEENEYVVYKNKKNKKNKKKRSEDNYNEISYKENKNKKKGNRKESNDSRNYYEEESKGHLMNANNKKGLFNKGGNRKKSSKKKITKKTEGRESKELLKLKKRNNNY